MLKRSVVFQFLNKNTIFLQIPKSGAWQQSSLHPDQRGSQSPSSNSCRRQNSWRCDSKIQNDAAIHKAAYQNITHIFSTSK